MFYKFKVIIRGRAEQIRSIFNECRISSVINDNWFPKVFETRFEGIESKKAVLKLRAGEATWKCTAPANS